MATGTFEVIYQHLIVNESGAKSYRAKTSEGIWGYVVDNGGATIHGVRWKYWQDFIKRYDEHDFFKNPRWKEFWDVTTDGQMAFNPALFKKVNFKQLSTNDVKFFYHAEYWDKVNGDNLPLGLDYYLFDFAVNSGPATAVKHIQRMVGVLADGKCGNNTLAAIEEYIDSNTIINTLEDIDEIRRDFMLSLNVSKLYMGGWDRRLVSVMRKCKELINVIHQEKRKPIEKSETIKAAKRQAGVAFLGLGGSAIPLTQSDTTSILTQLNAASSVVSAVNGIFSYGLQAVLLAVFLYSAYIIYIRIKKYYERNR